MQFDYAPAPESRSIVDIESNYGLFIGGSFTEPTSGEFFKTINPATEEVLSEVAEAGQADVDAAVAAARRAYDKNLVQDVRQGPRQVHLPNRPSDPGALSVSSRSLRPWITENRFESPADVDLPLVAAHFFYHAGWADKLEFGRLRDPTRSLSASPRR